MESFCEVDRGGKSKIDCEIIEDVLLLHSQRGPLCLTI